MAEEFYLAKLSFRIVQEDLVGAGSHNQCLQIHDLVLHDSSQLFKTHWQNHSFEAFRVLKVDARSQLLIELIDRKLDLNFVGGAFFNEVDEILSAISHIIHEIELIFEVDPPLLAHQLYLPLVDILKNMCLLHRHEQGLSQPHSFDCVAGYNEHAWKDNGSRSFPYCCKETAEILLVYLLQGIIGIDILSFLPVFTVLVARINVALVLLKVEVFNSIHIELAHDKWVLSHALSFMARILR